MGRSMREAVRMAGQSRKSPIAIVWAVAFAASGLLFAKANARVLSEAPPAETQAQPRTSPSNKSILEAAQQSALGVLTPGSSGSGVIVGHRGTTYLFATARHVMPSLAPGDEYAVYPLAKGSATQYRVTGLVDGPELKDLDIIFATFESADRLSVAPIMWADDKPGEVAARGESVLILGVSVPSRSVTVPVLRMADAVLQTRARGNQKGYELLYEATTVPGMSGAGLFSQVECPTTYAIGDAAIRLGVPALPPRPDWGDQRKSWEAQRDQLAASILSQYRRLAAASPYIAYADPGIEIPVTMGPEKRLEVVHDGRGSAMFNESYWDPPPARLLTSATLEPGGSRMLSGPFYAPVWDGRREEWRAVGWRFIRRDGKPLTTVDTRAVYEEIKAKLEFTIGPYPPGPWPADWWHIGLPGRRRPIPVLIGIHGMSEEYPSGGRSGTSLGIPMDRVSAFLQKQVERYGIAVAEQFLMLALTDYCAAP